MELKNGISIYIGISLIFVILCFYFLKRRKRKKYRSGTKIANLYLIEDTPYYKRKLRKYRIYKGILIIALMLGIFASSLLIARPYEEQKVSEEKYSRDIMLCLDVSESVDNLNKNIVKQLVDTVENLKGERFGIVIFNASASLVSPLTDDYKYVIGQLNTLERAMAARVEYREQGSEPDDWLYLEKFISSGTMIGNEERGGSLIGDGLATTAYNFSDLENNKTRIIIFSTDNEVDGKPTVTLEEAAKICKENNIFVYGVGTKEMMDGNMREMKKCMEQTGGEFYLEEESGTFEQIIKNIDSHSKDLTKGKSYVREIDVPQASFIILLASIFIMFLSTKLLKL